jgi:hypothetical protein
MMAIIKTSLQKNPVIMQTTPIFKRYQEKPIAIKKSVLEAVN